MLDGFDCNSKKRSHERIKPSVVERVDKSSFVACVVVEGKYYPCGNIRAEFETSDPVAACHCWSVLLGQRIINSVQSFVKGGGHLDLIWMES